MRAIRIVLPGVPPSLNRYAGRENTNEYRRDKKDWMAIVGWAVKGHRPKEPFGRAKVEILYYFRDKRRHDPDNYSGKFLLDGLREAGVISDDCFGKVTLHLDGAVDREHPRTVITVTEVIE